MPTKKKSVDFEQSLSDLEALVNQMEQGELSLEESLKAFERGIQLTRDCQERLSAAEQQVQVLMEQQGQISVQPMTPGGEDDGE
ncbi:MULTISPECIES: exodeoxyribonuclease VII small subunit [Marinimicrobium]|jgi:exodeoxyribonuclease VII small subunit|uniref:Exodeoxyribonuclease 7 small subunit n=1 Tax=Marinimicrobium koreense TaxID=306545 RepID=A0A3N1P8S5_9GAMM|nr:MULTISPECIES: exodeoxyribonuclease VII small subunit [Marinimicrobium]MAN50599.1 exodeoxyribonuclease VII small subunit [Marinimicrobium sp.]ROQ21126.1 exodeoxyribonuclease VII small subunit [Marinimicrobium koreense]|tara:strand:- start:329 stop:580 length:252 start_codon:yes stop_codon:yes gene_type:complete